MAENIVNVLAGGAGEAPPAAGGAEPGLTDVERHFVQIFGVPNPDVLVPDSSAWETDREWFHGGPAGLLPGELILPWDELGQTPDFRAEDDIPGGVWVTTDKTHARYYASHLGRGDVYRVRPFGLKADLDYPAPNSTLWHVPRWRRAPWLLTIGLYGNNCCSRAEILEVVERGVPPEARGGYVLRPKAQPTLVHRTARRAPLPPPRDPSGPYRICCVCHGNICRSPMAEAVLRGQLAKVGLGGRVTIDSAGIAGERGRPMDPQARAQLRRRGHGDGAAHRGRQFDASWLAERDLIIAMDESNLAVLRGLKPLP